MHKLGRIIVTGGGGFLGSYVIKHLKKLGYDPISIRSINYDLTKEDNVKRMLDRHEPDTIIHLAAKVGGIGYNRDNPVSLLEDNLLMGLYLIKNVQSTTRLTIAGTVCMYPKHCPVPFKEDDIWDGYPEETNAMYGLAKKMLLVQAEAYRIQHNFSNIVYVIPVNLYGPGDNFDDKSSHVIPALIKKFTTAKRDNLDTVTIWGTGSATREFIHADDAARGIVMATTSAPHLGPYNIGTSSEISIRDLVVLISDIVEYKGNIIWDTSKPDGQPRRKLDTSRARDAFGFESLIGFKNGLIQTIDWYRTMHR